MGKKYYRIEQTIKDINPDKYSEDSVKAKVEELKIYLENNKDKMHYKQYQDKGFFIGSGAIESAHKHVIQQRLKLAGMRWNKSGAQYISTLRAASKSNRWDKVKEFVYNKVC